MAQALLANSSSGLHNTRLGCKLFITLQQSYATQFSAEYLAACTFRIFLKTHHTVMKCIFSCSRGKYVYLKRAGKLRNNFLSFILLPMSDKEFLRCAASCRQTTDEATILAHRIPIVENT